MLKDGVCDQECNNSNCQFDLGDCDQCLEINIGDGICDEECYSEFHDYDGNDCGCAPGCRYSDYGSCLDECMHPNCLYDTIGEFKCQDNYKRTFWRYNHMFKMSFDSKFDPGSCDLDILKDSVDGICRDEGEWCDEDAIVHRMGACSSEDDCGDACLICATADACLKCDHENGWINYYSTCVKECPKGHQKHELDSSICYRISKDESSLTHPAKYYVNYNSSSENRDGSLDNPYRNILEVFEISISQFIEINLKPGIHVIDYFLPDSYWDLSLIVRSDPENPAILIIKNDFNFVQKNYKEIYLFNLVIETEGLGDDCTYIFSQEFDQDHYVPTCEIKEYKSLHSLFDLREKVNLYIKNVTFQNIDTNWRSIISSEKAYVRLNNVNFSNVKISDSFGVEYTCAVIFINPGWEGNLFLLVYYNGLVTNQGEPDNPYYSPFIYIQNIVSLIKNVVFYDNSILGTTKFLTNINFNFDLIPLSLIYTYGGSSLIENTKFIQNNIYFGLVRFLLFYSDENNIIVHSEFTDNTSEYPLVYFQQCGKPQGLQNTKFINCESESSIIKFDGDRDLEVDWFNIVDVSFENVYAMHLVDCEKVVNVYIRNFDISWANSENLKEGIKFKDFNIFLFKDVKNATIDEIEITNVWTDSVFCFISYTCKIGCVFEMNHLIFESIYYADDNSAIFAFENFDIEGSLSVKNSIFSNISNKLGISLFKIQNFYELSIENIQMEAIIQDTGCFLCSYNVENVYVDELKLQSYITKGDPGIYFLNSESVSMNNIEISDTFSPIYFKNCDLISIENFRMENSYGPYNGGIYFESWQNLFINNMHMKNITSEYNGGCLMLKFLELSSVTIENSSFDNCRSIKGSVMHIFSPSEGSVELDIRNSDFRNNYAHEDGSVLFVDTKTNIQSSKISNCNFDSNLSNGFTGVLVLFYTGHLEISDSNFTNNTSNGTAAIYGSFKTSENVLSLINVTFVENHGRNVLYLYSSEFQTSFMSKDCEFSLFSEVTVIIINMIWNDNNSEFSHSYRSILAESESALTFFSTSFHDNIGTKDPIVDISLSSLSCTLCVFQHNFDNLISVSLYSNSEFLSCVFTNNRSPNTSALIFYTNTNTAIIDNSLISNNTGQIINAYDSSLDIRESLFENSVSAYNSGISSNSAQIKFYDTDLSNLTSTDETPYIWLISSSILYFENSDINNLQGVYVSESELSLENVNLYVTKRGGFISTVNKSIIKIRNSLFEDLQDKSSDTAIINMINQAYFSLNSTYFKNFKSRVIDSQRTSDFLVTNCFFENGKFSTISLYDTVQASITDTKFADNYSNDNGAAIVAISSLSNKKNQVNILKCEFENNEAENGGAIYASNVILIVTDSNFFVNKANYGGSVYQQCTDQDKCYFYYENNIFYNNIASYIGGSIYWTGKSPVILNSTYENNKASYGNNIGSFPSKISIFSEDDRELQQFDNIASGQPFPYQIKLGLFDRFSELVTYGYDDSSAIMIGSDGVTLSGETKINPSQGIILFEGFTIISKPGQSSSFNITIPSIKNLPNEEFTIVDTLKFDFHMRECMSGESEENDQCVDCKRGFYSFNPSQKCTKCPNNAICYGKNIVAPDKGYWHGSNSSAFIYKCLNVNACLGGNINEIGYITTIGKCADGYKGNLCSTCEIGYANNSGFCVKCLSLSANIIIQIVIIGIVVFGIYIIVKSTLKSVYENRSFTSTYIKILINYIQMVSLASQLNLSWPDIVFDFLSVQNLIGQLATQIFSIDCFFTDTGNQSSYSNLYFIKLIISSFTPVVLAIFILVFYLVIYCRMKDKRLLKQECIGTICIMFFLIYPTITKQYFSVLACKDLYGILYWMSNLDVKCYEGDHLFYTLLVSIPAIIIWSIGVPMLILLYLYKKRHELHKSEIKIRLGFLYNNYKSKLYYWEFVILARKLIFILLTQSLSTISSDIQALACFSILLAFLYLQKINSPFTMKELNSSEFFSIYVAAATLYAGLYYVTQEVTNYGKIVLFSFMLLSNAYFLVHLSTQILIEAYGYVLKKSRYLKYLYGDTQIDNKKEKVWQADIVKVGQNIVEPWKIHKDLYLAALKNIKS